MPVESRTCNALTKLSATTDNAIRAGQLERRIHGILRVGVAMCFIGHGVFGILRKTEWIPYFGVVGIPADAAFSLMPVIGAFDISIGIAALLSPRPAILLYMAIWGLWTALLRPLAGESAWEVVERAGNYGVPFAFLLWAGGSWRNGLAHIPVGSASVRRGARAAAALRLTTTLLLFGHGALGALTNKSTLAVHYASIGLPADTVALVGWTEISLAAVVLLSPGVGLYLLVAAWKAASELLFPISGAPVWEWIERGGSYAAPLGAAVLMLLSRCRSPQRGGMS